jgi:asparagine synthase (glutamine-hydrolysing)
MCAIVGCFRESGTGQPPVPVRDLLEQVRHRGPDDVGVHETGNAALAQARLSIIDVPGGHQPLSNEDGRVWITYNGEIYNYRQLRERLAQHVFRTATDTEVLVHLYEVLGPAAVTQLDGMYAFALLDGEALMLARDPLGVKPLYTARRDGWLYFASEIKALLPVTEDVEEFPPGHWWDSRTGWKQFFDLEHWVANGGPADDPLREVRMALAAAVEKRLVADVPVGVFLSGGLDSSLVAALMRPHVAELHSFSVGMAGSDDLRFARQVAEFLGTTHHEHVFTEAEMRAALPAVIRHLESFDFALVRSAVANWFVAQLAAQYVKVVLVGEGADEIFAGYHYLKDLDPTARARELFRITNALHNANLQRVDRMTMAHGLEGREPYLDLYLLRAAFHVPVELRERDGIEKWALRQACSGLVPAEVLWRRKEKFSRGAGSAEVFARHAEAEIGDAAFARERHLPGGHALRSKEELLYYRVFRHFYPESVSRCLSWTAAPQAR